MAIDIRRDAVGVEHAAAFAAVDDRPLAALSHPDGHGFHDPAAVGRAVAGVNIDMQAREAIGAMVPVVRAGVFRDDGPAADLADEGVAAGVGFIVVFFKGFAFVFAIHVKSS